MQQSWLGGLPLPPFYFIFFSFSLDSRTRIVSPPLQRPGLAAASLCRLHVYVCSFVYARVGPAHGGIARAAAAAAALAALAATTITSMQPLRLQLDAAPERVLVRLKLRARLVGARRRAGGGQAKRVADRGAAAVGAGSARRGPVALARGLGRPGRPRQGQAHAGDALFEDGAAEGRAGGDDAEEHLAGRPGADGYVHGPHVDVVLAKVGDDQVLGHRRHGGQQPQRHEAPQYDALAQRPLERPEEAYGC